jgi:tetratricopeptide (TPR) repeat protein
MLRNRTLTVVLAAAIVLAASLVYVPGDSVAVRESAAGAVPLGPGFHLRVPLYQRVYRYDTAPVSIDRPVQVVSRDNATFQFPVTLSARVSAGDVLTFHQGRAGRETRVYLEERVQEAILAAARTLNADDLLDPEVGRRLGQAVSADLIARGITDSGLVLGRPSPRVVFNATLDHLNRDLPASARRLAERALEADPRQALHHAAIGAVLEAEGDRAGAEQAYLEALVLDPTALEPMSRLYVMYQFTRDPAKIQKLERLLTASLEKQQDSAIHHDWLGQVYLRTGRHDRAEMAFTAAIGLAPKEPEFRISLGSLKAKMGKLDEARAAFRQALELRPNHPLALYNLGVSYALEGSHDRAIEQFQQAERSGPPSVMLLNALAQAHEEKGDTARAVEYLKRSLAVQPEQPDRQADLRRLEGRLRKRG